MEQVKHCEFFLDAGIIETCVLAMTHIKSQKLKKTYIFVFPQK